MATLIAIAYPDEFRAAEVMATIQRLQKSYLIDLADACYVTKGQDAKVKLHQAVNLTTSGAVSGGFWGSLVGLLFLNPLLGAAVGAAAGALSGSVSDYGINDDFMKDLGDHLQPGSSAIFLLTLQFTEDKVLPQLAQFGGKILHTSLSQEAESRYQAALDAGH